MGRRQASLGTLVPRTPTVAPGPKARSDLASRRSQGASAERRGPQQPAALVDAWRLIGHGRLRFPMLPRQLPDLTSPCDMQGKTIITCDRGGRWLAFSGYKWGGGGAPIAHLFLVHLLLPPCSTASSNGAVEEVLRHGEGQGPLGGTRLPGAQARTWLSPQACCDPRRSPRLSRWRRSAR